MTTLPLDDPRAAQILGWMADHLRRFPKEYEAAKIVALNRVGASLNKRALKILTDRYAAKRADIARKVTVTKANSGAPFVMIRGEGRPLHLASWPRKTFKLYAINSRRLIKGLRVNILKGSGYKFLEGGFGGFSKRHKKKKVFLLYRREGQSRMPIKVLYGPSMIGHLTHPENQEPLMELARNNLETELRRQAQFRLGRLGIL
jgi:hypothetical protein